MTIKTALIAILVLVGLAFAGPANALLFRAGHAGVQIVRDRLGGVGGLDWQVTVIHWENIATLWDADYGNFVVNWENVEDAWNI